jgi:endonuclease YncB( thermonuclease family)
LGRLPARAGLTSLLSAAGYPEAAWLLPPVLLLLAVAAATAALWALRRRRWRVGGAMALLALAGTALAVQEVAGLLAPAPPARPGPAARGQVLSGPVAHVRDGDTIVVGQTPIRFTDVDCPENGTPEGERATQALRRLAAGRMVQCRLEGRRSYDREIGICTLPGGTNLGQELVAQGLCLRR